MLFSFETDNKTKELINRRMNQILVHSYLYSVDNAILDDYTWDLWAKELVKLIKDNIGYAKTLPYYNQFIDWGGDTSMNFVYDDTIINRAKLCYFCKTGSELQYD